MFEIILSAVIAYLLGSVSVAVIISKIIGTDVRKQGSGNAGATNVARVLGMRAGIITLLGDMVKTAISGLIGYILAGENGMTAACFACLVGHCWPVWFGFKGGKGVAVAGCIALLFDWRFFLIILVLFAVVFAIWRRVSLGSVTAAVIYPISYWLLHPGFSPRLIACIIMALMVIWLHRANIGRLIRGEEPKFKAKSKK